ncbi:flagellar motor protein MotB [Microbulbifer thermotolerans]|uniref:flagellar motor protein MotB n=1 Tax=Microbulbifer thermotolerans TaxID=252514 RepID=UPI0008EFE6BC|nr:flagellar motor protein MotB [Microbulbifer thermotolerans]MCX2783509.1 flagellar motor protein MotB [Microbulbifer thermotolerans]MCX2795903.1 flagellar motor protein MotB [Microbulbifer thermotolerans]MCX2835561.1 flagellar motor protein MotB [Microbulbifer thermotolerans]WKT59773.1 flagellar motor protein MotB [Microbulbifer thermotolerans]SFC60781.1 chemotaxis protein MotB [Microbulbifer thermotolerans]
MIAVDKVERRIVIRRPRKGEEAYHGGSWKIALADLMTALMSLFLVLWIISAASPQQLAGLAEYFRTPLAVALSKGDRDSASTSVIPGGGTDPAHVDGERARVDMRTQRLPTDVRRSLLELRHRIETVMEAKAELRDLREQTRFEMTPEGMRIQLLDTESRPMFRLGSDRVEPYMRDLLRTMAPLLNELPNQLAISGHTDSLTYAAGDIGYSNWELSADRANASRRELVAGGLDSAKLLRVTGMGDRVPIPGSAPGDPVNRRISIMVLSDQAAARILAGHWSAPLQVRK